jgi:hypothetical protein
MDFFGFSSNAANDASSQVGMMIKVATDPSLESPDWARSVFKRIENNVYKLRCTVYRKFVILLSY